MMFPLDFVLKDICVVFCISETADPEKLDCFVQGRDFFLLLLRTVLHHVGNFPVGIACFPQRVDRNPPDAVSKDHSEIRFIANPVYVIVRVHRNNLCSVIWYVVQSLDYTVKLKLMPVIICADGRNNFIPAGPVRRISGAIGKHITGSNTFRPGRKQILAQIL